MLCESAGVERSVLWQSGPIAALQQSQGLFLGTGIGSTDGVMGQG
jgi:hypothetical protein